MVGFPNNHGVFLLKMDHFRVFFWGETHHLRKHTKSLPWMFHDNYGSPFVDHCLFEWVVFFLEKTALSFFSKGF